MMTEEQFEKWRAETVSAWASRGERGADILRKVIAEKDREVRVRRAASLVVTWESGRYKVHNFVTRQAFACKRACLELLTSLTDWTDARSLVDSFPNEPVERLAVDLGRLVELGAIAVEGSGYAALDSQYRSKWDWGAVAGLYHFGIKDIPYDLGGGKLDWIIERAAERPSPKLHLTNESFSVTIILPPPDLETGIFRTMRDRRSVREFSAAPISHEALTQIIYSGLGITTFRSAESFGVLPLKMTPSGGARNPYEGYVMARNVEGLEPALYHYSGAENSLGRNSDEPLLPPSRLLANQVWIEEAAAVVFLVANFPRTMWKYDACSAYRVVLIEAGHIAQNMLLAASHLRIAATPTAAVSDSVAECALGLDPVEQAVVYAVVLGRAQT